MTNKMDLYSGPRGARDLILECREMLAGRRRQFTPRNRYVAQRLGYWEAKAARTARPARATSEKAA